jgi:hypothetical protein
MQSLTYLPFPLFASRPVRATSGREEEKELERGGQAESTTTSFASRYPRQARAALSLATVWATIS